MSWHKEVFSTLPRQNIGGSVWESNRQVREIRPVPSARCSRLRRPIGTNETKRLTLSFYRKPSAILSFGFEIPWSLIQTFAGRCQDATNKRQVQNWVSEFKSCVKKFLAIAS